VCNAKGIQPIKNLAPASTPKVLIIWKTYVGPGLTPSKIWIIGWLNTPNVVVVVVVVVAVVAAAVTVAVAVAAVVVVYID